MSRTPIIIDPLYLSTSRIQGFVWSEERNSATGFRWLEGDQKFIVTNKHVILGKEFVRNPQPLTSIRLRCHQQSNLSQNSNVDIQLFSGTNPVWLEHQNSEVDLVLIPVRDNEFYNLAFPPFARLHHGTSGAPVLFITRGSYRTTGSLNIGDLPPVLLGIHSGTWPTRLDEEPLNLNATWFSSLIPEIISNPRVSVVRPPES